MADGSEKTNENTRAQAQVIKKVEEEAARLEVNKFLDLKRVPERKRKESLEQQVDDLVNLVVDGRLTFDFEEKRATYRLLVPLTPLNGNRIESLSLRFYIGMQEANNVLKKVPVGEVDSRSLSLAAALSGNDPNVFRNVANELGEKGLDISDHNSLYAYTLFFLS